MDVRHVDLLDFIVEHHHEPGDADGTWFPADRDDRVGKATESSSNQ